MSRSSGNNPLNSSGPILHAVKVDPDAAGAPARDVVYFAVKTSLPGERRAEPRRRTRLRSGIILDPVRKFFVDCVIYDCSKGGARLRLHSNARVPFRIRLLDEVAKKVTDAHVVWRRNGEMGICFAPLASPRELKTAELARLRAQFHSAGH